LSDTVEYYGLSGKIKQYISGLLLLALAGFILGAVNHVISIIPETTITVPSEPPSESPTPPPPTYSTPELLSTLEQDRCVVGAEKYDIYTVNLGSPPSGKKYMIMFRDASANIRYFRRLDIIVNTTTYSNITTVSNNTHYFAEWSMGITRIHLYYDGYACYPHPLHIYLVDSNMPLPPPPDVWDTTPRPTRTPTPTPTPTPTLALSSKTILEFISWIASIALVITALHKFDIYI
jgi:hypothetical protein